MSQQWEYCIFTTGYTVALEPPMAHLYAGVTFCQPTGNITKEVENKDVPVERDEKLGVIKEALIQPRDLTQIAARLGLAGWEMLSVHINSTSRVTIDTMFCKRPVEPGRPIDDAF